MSPRAVKDLQGVEDDQKIEILRKIDSLKDNPAPPEAKKLRGFKHPTYRLRQGQFRIGYRVEKGRLVVLILAIGDRKDIYERLKRLA